jgi:hypothetical protein
MVSALKFSEALMIVGASTSIQGLSQNVALHG